MFSSIPYCGDISWHLKLSVLFPRLPVVQWNCGPQYHVLQQCVLQFGDVISHTSWRHILEFWKNCSPSTCRRNPHADTSTSWRGSRWITTRGGRGRLRNSLSCNTITHITFGAHWKSRAFRIAPICSLPSILADGQNSPRLVLLRGVLKVARLHLPETNANFWGFIEIYSHYGRHRPVAVVPWDFQGSGRSDGVCWSEVVSNLGDSCRFLDCTHKKSLHTNCFRWRQYFNSSPIS